MRINERSRSNIETKRIRSRQKGQRTFEQMVQSQTIKLTEQELDRMIEDISAQGERLSRSRTIRDLVAFKRLVKDFLEKTVYQGYQLHVSQNFSLQGNSQQLSLVKEIDKQLVQLTESIMNQESKNVDLLGLIGEIKGLLINLYT